MVFMNGFFEQNQLEKFYADHPDSIVFAFLAAKYIESGMTQKARSIVEKGVKKHPTYAFGHYILGLCYFRLNDLNSAKNSLELSVAYDDKNLQAWKLLGDINQELDLPLSARDNNLQYYLLDPFNKEAADEFQRSEMMQLNEFEAMQLEGDFSDKTGEFDDLHRGEASLEELFEVEMDESDDLDITQKVDEVFKETLGDFTIDREETAATPAEEDAPAVDDFENIDLFDADETQQLPKFDLTEEKVMPEKEPQEKPPAEEEFEEIDIVSELDDFFSEYEIEDLGNETAEDEDKDDMNFGNILFSESRPGDETKPKEADVDLLDYNSMVEEIIVDDSGESGGESESTAEEKPDFPYAHEPDETFPSEDVDTELPGSQPAASAPRPSGNTTRFGRPPILSPTLGEIYISQGRFEEAIEVFRQLLEKDPENTRFQKKIKDIQTMLDRQKS
jgi:tetratricopeptide (TPR) repeat protein